MVGSLFALVLKCHFLIAYCILWMELTIQMCPIRPATAMTRKVHLWAFQKYQHDLCTEVQDFNAHQKGLQGIHVKTVTQWMLCTLKTSCLCLWYQCLHVFQVGSHVIRIFWSMCNIFVIVCVVCIKYMIKSLMCFQSMCFMFNNVKCHATKTA